MNFVKDETKGVEAVADESLGLIEDTCLLIACHESCLTQGRQDTFSHTLRCALLIFPPEAIFVCDNGGYGGAGAVSAGCVCVCVCVQPVLVRAAPWRHSRCPRADRAARRPLNPADRTQDVCNTLSEGHGSGPRSIIQCAARSTQWGYAFHEWPAACASILAGTCTSRRGTRRTRCTGRPSTRAHVRGRGCMCICIARMRRARAHATNAHPECGGGGGVGRYWIPELVRRGESVDFGFGMIIDDDVPLPPDLHVSARRRRAQQLLLLRRACRYAFR